MCMLLVRAAPAGCRFDASDFLLCGITRPSVLGFEQRTLDSAYTELVLEKHWKTGYGLERTASFRALWCLIDSVGGPNEGSHKGHVPTSSVVAAAVLAVIYPGVDFSRFIRIFQGVFLSWVAFTSVHNIVL